MEVRLKCQVLQLTPIASDSNRKCKCPLSINIQVCSTSDPNTNPWLPHLKTNLSPIHLQSYTFILLNEVTSIRSKIAPRYKSHIDLKTQIEIGETKNEPRAAFQPTSTLPPEHTYRTPAEGTTK